MIKSIIIEDERLAQDVIKTHLLRVDGYELTGTCRNAIEARNLLAREQVDLMFLDIQLPGMTGIEFLRSLENPPLVILTTAHPEYAAESYELNVIDYLLKPISFERFRKTIDRIAENRLFDATEDGTRIRLKEQMLIRSNGRFQQVRFSDIFYIEGMKDYLKMHTAEGIIITHRTMIEMEQLLPAKRFVRIHKSYIVGTPHIRAIEGNSLRVAGIVLPIGLNYKERVSQYIADNSARKS